MVILNKQEAEKRIYMIDLQLEQLLRDFDGLKKKIPELEAEKKLLNKLLDTYKWEAENAKERNIKSSC